MAALHKVRRRACCAQSAADEEAIVVSLRSGLLVESAWNAFGWLLHEQVARLQCSQQPTYVVINTMLL